LQTGHMTKYCGISRYIVAAVLYRYIKISTKKKKKKIRKGYRVTFGGLAETFLLHHPS
jgi:hypothetical protein